MVHGHVTAMVTVQTALMKLTVAVTKVVQMVNLNVLMAVVSMVHGHVTAMVTVQTALMKLTVANFLVKTKVYGTVAMANVFQHFMYVMDHLNSVTQDGDQTVQMVQMKV
jgi:molybdopterin-binding protein